MAHYDDPRRKYEAERDRLEDMQRDTQAVRAVLDALDPEVRSETFEHRGESAELASATLKNYAQRLRMVLRERDRPLLELSQDDVSGLMGDLADGDTGIGPADGYAESTLGQFASALIAFYRYHDGHAVDPESIDVPSQESSSIDERDLWDVDEIAAMRDVIDSKRNEALFELLAYTGQRIRVIQTLRVRDVDLDAGNTGRYYVNEEVEGRKNREGKGPLLGAQGPVRRWLQVHPKADVPSAALVTCPPKRTGGATPGDMVTQTSFRGVLQRIADAAGVEKDVHPHMFRHYFSTVALTPEERGGYGMEPTYVKRLRGDAPGSNVLETTYAHLIDEDAAAHAEGQFGSDDSKESALVPAAPCGICGEMLQAGDRACSNCGAKRAPSNDPEVEFEELKAELREKLERYDELEEELEA